MNYLEEFAYETTIGKVAKEFGVTLDTLRRWEKEGKITSETCGGHRRYDLEQVHTYVNQKNKKIEK